MVIKKPTNGLFFIKGDKYLFFIKVCAQNVFLELFSKKSRHNA